MRMPHLTLRSADSFSLRARSLRRYGGIRTPGFCLGEVLIATPLPKVAYANA
jgi:hypothetical protein